MENLPNELLEEIICYLNLEDAKSLSLCSKRMKQLTARRIWSVPRFTIISSRELIKEVRCKEKPIKTLHLSDFRYRTHVRTYQSFAQIPTLAVIDIDEYVSLYDIPLQYFKDRYHLHISHVSITDRYTNYANILEELDCSIYFNSFYTYFSPHYTYFIYTPPYRWSLQRLTYFENIKITKLDLDCIYFEKEICEYQQFKRLISFIKRNNPKELLLEGKIIDVSNISAANIVTI